jgi:hypothetical protein
MVEIPFCAHSRPDCLIDSPEPINAVRLMTDMGGSKPSVSTPLAKEADVPPMALMGQDRNGGDGR